MHGDHVVLNTLVVEGDTYQVKTLNDEQCRYCLGRWRFTWIAGPYIPAGGERALTHDKPECRQFATMQPEEFLRLSGVKL